MLDIYKKSPIFYSFLITTGVVRVTIYVTRDWSTDTTP